MLRLGQVLVGLVGIAALVLSALAAFTFLVGGLYVGYGYFVGTNLPLGGVFLVLAVAMLVGTVLILGGSAWGAVLIALWTAGMLVWVLGRGSGPFAGTAIVLAIATVLAVVVAIGTAPRQGPAGVS